MEERIQGFRLDNAAAGLPLEKFLKSLVKDSSRPLTKDRAPARERDIVFAGKPQDFSGVVVTRLQFKTEWHYERRQGRQRLLVLPPSEDKLKVGLNFFAGRIFDNSIVGLYQSFAEGFSLSEFVAWVKSQYAHEKKTLHQNAVDQIQARVREKSGRRKREAEVASQFREGLHHQWICSQDQFEQAIAAAAEVRSFEMGLPPDKTKLLGHGTPAGDVFQRASGTVRIRLRYEKQTAGVKEAILNFVSSPWRWSKKKLRERHSAEIIDENGIEQHLYVSMNRQGFPGVSHDEVMSSHLLATREDGGLEIDYSKLQTHPVVQKLKAIMTNNPHYFG